MSDPFLQRAAVLAFDGTCRLSLTRVWAPERPLAAWLLCNPSTADAEQDDNTSRRMAHFSRVVGCGGFVAVNYRPWRTPYPAELWRALKAGLISEEMMVANDAAITAAATAATVHFVAFGAEPPRRDPGCTARALRRFQATGLFEPLLCLGVTPDGWPLHPLARGKFAIPNDRAPRPWQARP